MDNDVEARVPLYVEQLMPRPAGTPSSPPSTGRQFARLKVIFAVLWDLSVLIVF